MPAVETTVNPERVAHNTILYASLAIMLAAVIARASAYLTSVEVNNATYVLLFISTGFALFFLHFERLQLGAWAFFIGTLAAMFNNSLSGAQGQSLALTGYVIALVLAILILPGQQWRIVLGAASLACAATAVINFFQHSPDPEAIGQLGIGVMQLCYLFVAAFAVGYLYSGVLRLIARLRHANAILTDLQSEQVLREQALSESNQRLNLILDNVPVRVVYMDAEENVTFGNRDFAEHYMVGDSESTTAHAILGPDYAFCKPFMDRALAGDLVTFDMVRSGEFDGQFSYVTYVPHMIDDRVEGLISLALDTTRWHSAEKALQEKTELLENITDNLPARINYTSKDRHIKFFNKAFAKKYQMTAEKFAAPILPDGTGIRRLSSLRDQGSEYEQRVLAGENLSFEWQDTDEQGITRFSQVDMVPHVVNGEVAGYISLAFDITERKQAARELREKSQLLETITAFSPVRTAYFDKDENLNYYNHAFYAAYAQNLGEALRNSDDWTRFLDHVDPELHAQRLPYVAAANRGEAVKFEINENINGQSEYVQNVLVPHIENGEVIGRVSLGIDVTELRATQHSLQSSLDIFDHVINNVPARIVYIDENNTIVFVNDRIETDFDVAVADAVGRNAKDVFPNNYFEKVTPYVMQAIETKTRVMFDAPVVLADGTEIIERSYLYPHFKEGSGYDALFMLHMDVTDIKRSEESLNKAQRLESLGVLAGGIAHDFNNLLVAMLGQSSLALAKTSKDHPARRHIQQSVAASERAATLTQQMLAYSGRGSFAIGVINLNDVIRNNLKLFEVSIPRNVQLVTDLDENLPAIQADPAQMQQLVMNLIINAGQAIGDDNGRVTIQTSIETMTSQRGEFWEITGDELVPGQYVSIQVQDDGVGMDEETKNRIFDPFYTTKDTGTGLGLAAALGIIRGHQGGIRLYSEVGRGTVFHLLFPIKNGEDGLVEVEREEIEPVQQRHTILVIDDEVGVVNAVADMLEMKDIFTIQATRGKDGLRIYKQRQDEISLVLLDLMMPEMNGEKVFQELREINPDVKVVLSSGYSEAEATRRFIGQSLADFIQKPYDFQSLVNKILDVLEPEPA